MQVGPGQGGKGVASSPNRMEQGFVMPATCGAYDESLYRSGQQSMPVPPSTPSNSSRNQGKGSASTPEEIASGQQGLQGSMPTFGVKAVVAFRKVLELVRLVLSSNKEMGHVFSLLDFSTECSPSHVWKCAWCSG